MRLSSIANVIIRKSNQQNQVIIIHVSSKGNLSPRARARARVCVCVSYPEFLKISPHDSDNIFMERDAW